MANLGTLNARVPTFAIAGISNYIGGLPVFNQYGSPLVCRVFSVQPLPFPAVIQRNMQVSDGLLSSE